MKASVNRFIILTLFLLTLFLSLFCFYLISSKKQNFRSDFSFEKERKIEVLERDFLVGLTNNQTILDKETEVNDLEGNSLKFNQVLNEKPVLVVRISENNCEECITFLSNKIIRMYSDKKQEQQIIFLVSFYNRAALKMITNRLGNSFAIFQIENLPLFAETYNYPYCFMIDSSMIIGHVFVPDKHEPELANRYFEQINKRYFELENSM